MSGNPRISVVVPTRGRLDSLLRTLRALDGPLAPDGMEILVVVDGAPGDVPAAIRSLGLVSPVAVLDQSPAGAAAARNLGADSARGATLVFVDDDVEPLPGLLEAHLAAQETAGGAVVIGPYHPWIPISRRLHPILIREWWSSKFAEMARPEHRFSHLDLLAGNLSIPASTFRDLGGFDPAFPEAGGEDWEFGVRVIEAGVRITYAPAAAALHHEGSTPRKSFRRAWLEGRADVRIGERHPWLRPSLPFAWWARAGRQKRLARALAFRAPALGALAVAAAPAALRALEALRMRRAWMRLGHLVRHHCYWRGVSELLPSSRAFREFLEAGGQPARETRCSEVDLRAGIEEARRFLDRERPDSVTLRYGPIALGEMPPLPATEPLCGRHLEGLLASFGHILLAARALCGDPVVSPVEPAATRGSE